MTYGYTPCIQPWGMGRPPVVTVDVVERGADPGHERPGGCCGLTMDAVEWERIAAGSSATPATRVANGLRRGPFAVSPRTHGCSTSTLFDGDASPPHGPPSVGGTPYCAAVHASLVGSSTPQGVDSGGTTAEAPDAISARRNDAGSTRYRHHLDRVNIALTMPGRGLTMPTHRDTPPRRLDPDEAHH